MRVAATQDSRAYAMFGHAWLSPVTLATALESTGEEQFVRTLPHGTQPTYGESKAVRLDESGVVRSNHLSYHKGSLDPLLDWGNSHHASLGDGKAEQNQEDTQNRSDLNGEAPRLALKGRTEG